MANQELAIKLVNIEMELRDAETIIKEALKRLESALQKTQDQYTKDTDNTIPTLTDKI